MCNVGLMKARPAAAEAVARWPNVASLLVLFRQFQAEPARLGYGIRPAAGD